MHIHYITNTRNGLKVGERNQALGVVDALRVSYPDAIILEHDVSEIGHLNVILQKFNTEQHVIIGVSDSGVQAFSQLPAGKRHVGVLIGHETPEYLETVADKISILAIPSYVEHCPAAVTGVNIIRTDGVANTMTVERVASAYRDWQDKFLVDKDQPVIVAMLGGAVDGRDFLPEEAEKMAEYIAQLAKRTGAYILASNSPRTRLQDTEAFTDILNRSGYDNVFFPFYMKNQNNETPYRAMVGMATKDPRNRIIITSDSVSMPCEIARVVPSEQIYLYPVSNLNRQNREFVRWMCVTGRARKVDAEHFTEEHLPGPPTPLMDAAGQIARAVLGKI